MQLRSRLLRHGGPGALLVLAAASIAVRGGPPPSTPCDGEWVWHTWQESTTCGGTEERGEWECQESNAISAPLSFEPNAGQAPAGVQFVARSRGLSVLLEGGDAVLGMAGPGGTARLRMHLDGANRSAGVEGVDPLPGVANYLVGRDTSRWLTNIPSFAKIRYRDVYPGIDAVYYGRDGELEHDFVVRPGADPSRIRMLFEGAAAVRLESDGSLAAVVDGLRVTWRQPVLYQMLGGRKTRVEGHYRISGNAVAFDVANYDRQVDLVIDPVVAYVSYFGRSSADAGGRMVVDSAGNAYTAGMTFDAFFPVTAGAPSVSKGNFGDILITKFNPSGTQVVYSTHIGGANAEGATAIAVDGSGNIYLTGTSNSDDYPVSPRAVKGLLQPPGALNDPMDCVVTKINAAGNAILYSTYFGGSKNDTCTAIATDADGNAYVTGYTSSTSIPVSDEAPQRAPRGGAEGFLFKLNPDATGFVYSTMFGGGRDDGGLSVAVDAAGNAYVAGFTNSNFGFPITSGALQTAWGGTRSLAGTGDAFILKMNPAGNQFVYSTFLGGDRDDAAFSIAVDQQGNAYVAGNTSSSNFRTTEGAYQRENKGGGGNNRFPGGDAWVAKLNPAGNALIYSTLIGGARDDWATSLAVDSAGNAYVAGSTLSADFPVSQDAYQSRYGGAAAVSRFPTGDAFLAQINPAGTALTYSTYLGGSGDEIGFGVALDRVGGVYVSGTTLSANLPATPGAAQRDYGGTSRQVVPFGDVFMARFGAPIVDPNTPSIKGFGSAANGAAVSVSPGEWILIKGTHLGPAERVDFSAAADGSVATTLAGTRVWFDDMAAPVMFTSEGAAQVAVPFGIAGKTSIRMIVEVNALRSEPLTIPVTPAKPTLFTSNGQGNGQGSIIHLADGSANSAGHPAYPGDWVAVLFTGGGQMSPAAADGFPISEGGAVLETAAVVTVGGREAEVSYAGGAYGQIAGLYRADLRLPDGLEAGEHEVVIRIGDAQSQAGVTIAVQVQEAAAETSASRTKVRKAPGAWLPTRLPAALSSSSGRTATAGR